MEMMNEDPGALIPELALLGAAVLGLLAGSWLPRRRQWLIAALAGLAFVAGIVATALAYTRPAETVFGSYAIDPTTNATRLIVLVATLLAVGASVDAARGQRRETEYWVLLLLGALGSVLMAGATDLLLLFAAFLLASIPLYALVGWSATSTGTEGAMKYYLSGAFAGVTMITGVTLLNAAGRGTAYVPLRENLTAAAAGGRSMPALAAVGLVAVLAGLAFKAGAVPAQFWVPDVSDGAPAPVAGIVTTIPKIGALVAVYRLLTQAIPEHAIDWPLIVAILAAASMSLGNLAAFLQTSVQRLLGYSAISQVGYVLMAAAVAARTPQAGPALLLYLAAYAITNLGAFAVAAAVTTPEGPARTVNDYRGLARRRPVLAGALVVCLLGLVGTPPTAVFLGKLAVFTAAVDGGMAWLTVLAIVNTVASLFYYLRWIAPLFTTPAPTAGPSENHGLRRRWASGVAVVAALTTLIIGVGAQALLGLLTTVP
ncbi:NADH-quinone oxidoreductase subunit N [Pseudonocardia sp. RS11V-5]|uniref:NADH-quinone oxidoreductase subunit N n=1 Tax=Pseudonocardia terrae TaxID=2905831 RepID=UPI001E2E8091|nr:NADH-quinone oxidoreductase subunit N [Pseudonocardia terrae]MCE3555463.1 NADH-quinone oxidoreductase subunit N [Pseudonocardia terrae]